ncbi:MAG: hypothetical protein SNH79_00010 [Rikenellaceae bacterium]
MANWLVVLLFSVGAVAFFVLGLSVTLIVKGRYMDNEISTNPNMKRLGITCAVHDSRAEESGVDCVDLGCHSHSNCAACDVETEQK